MTQFINSSLTNMLQVYGPIDGNGRYLNGSLIVHTYIDIGKYAFRRLEGILKIFCYLTKFIYKNHINNLFNIPFFLSLTTQ